MTILKITNNRQQLGKKRDPEKGREKDYIAYYFRGNSNVTF